VYQVKWKQLLFYALDLLILLSLLAFLSDISLASIQATIFQNIYEIRQRYDNLNISKDDNQNYLLKPWLEAWDEGIAPEKRSVQITFSEDTLTVDYYLEIKSDHPIADYVLTGYSLYSPKAFVEPVFGQVFFDNAQNTLSDENFQSPDIQINPESGNITAHFLATQKISSQGSVHLIRKNQTNKIDLEPRLDTVVINYAGRKLTLIYPMPTNSSEGTLVYEATAPNTVGDIHVTAEVPQTSEVIANILSRQALLQKVGKLLNIPFVSNILGAILEALPFLIFLRLVSSWQGEKPKILIFLSELVITLLTFHFAYYFGGGVTNLLSRMSDLLRGVNLISGPLRGVINELTMDFDNNFIMDFLSSYTPFGFLMVQIIFVGVLVSAMLLRRSKELDLFPELPLPDPSPLGKFRKRAKPSKKVSWLSFITYLILILSFALPLLYYYGFSQGYDNLEIILVLILMFGITGILSIIFLHFIYRQLDGQPDTPSVIPIAFWLLIAGNVIWAITNAISFILESGLINPYAGWGWFVYSTMLGSILVYAFMRIVYVLFAKAGWVKPLTSSRKLLIGILALISSVPMRLVYSSTASPADYYEVLRLAAQLDDLIGFVFLAGLVWYFYEEGQKGPSLNPITLSVGLIAALTLLYRSSSNWLYIPITFILGYRFLSYFFLPAEHWNRLKLLYKRVFKERIEFLEEIVSLNMAERAYRELYKTLSAKMGKGESDYASFKKKIDDRREELDIHHNRAKVRGKPIKDVALTFGPKETAWANAVNGAFWAAIFAIPWMGIWLFNFMAGEATTVPYPLWSFFGDLLNLLLSWIGIGFLFGYFYPYLRGGNGLQKGLWLWMVAVLPSLPLALINNSTMIQWQGFLFWALQMFLHCMLLGLIAFDYMTLRQGYRDWQMLFELHGIPSIGISISSILLAAGTAITALFQEQTQEIIKFALTFILPNADKFINLP